MPPVPTIAETETFIHDNKLFFEIFLPDYEEASDAPEESKATIPVLGERHSDFEQLYDEENKLDDLKDYSTKLKDLLYKHRENISLYEKKPVIYAWNRRNFKPALQHETIRQFIIDNSEHPAVLFCKKIQLSFLEKMASELASCGP